MIVLDWNGSVMGTGTQIDRVGAIWISGSEIFRTSTPTTGGTTWHVEKDVSEYSTTLTSSNNLTSIVTTYSGEIKVTATLSFAFQRRAYTHSHERQPGSCLKDRLGSVV